jgi:DNA repair exonuclease SbcCD ATPase subunit
MSITLKNITVKNFMSVGAVLQSVKFDQPLTLILGCNLDLGGEESSSRNGVGKTTLINALSYALYGQALANIRKENLINTINGKAMYVTIEFDKAGVTYRIERGRKPNVLKFFVNNQIQKDGSNEDESQGDSRETQKEIERVIGMSHTMFKHLVALNTYTEPFLSMRVSDQREVIEQLLGITMLSEKAELLKVQIKELKDKVASELFRIEAIKNSNESVQISIRSIETKSRLWETKKSEELEKLSISIAKLEELDSDLEIQAHNALATWKTNDKALSDLIRQQNTLNQSFVRATKLLEKAAKSKEELSENRCPTCNQGIHDHKHAELLEKATSDLADADQQVLSLNDDIAKVSRDIIEIGDLPRKPVTFYATLAEALEHKNNLNNLTTRLISRNDESNPYDEQVADLKASAIQEIDWDVANNLNKLKDHHEFLLKLLTNKDSFVRKKIIDQNLAYLNSRLAHYISKMGLPHIVVFENDLSVTITQLGKDLDYHNLSRGEMNRLILSLSFSFRDVWESLYHSINITFIDELLDSGLDGAGVEAGLSLLKKMARERNKNIYLISHREELVGRVDNILRVVKENGFTTFLNSDEVAEEP